MTEERKDVDLTAGALVWWDLHGTRITPNNMRAILHSEGEDESIVPDINPVTAIKEAARLYREGSGNSDRYRCEVIKSSKTEITVGLLQRVRRSDSEVGWDQVGVAEYTISKGWNSDCHLPEMQAFIELALVKQTYLDHGWIRPKLLQARLDEWKSFPIRRQGGIYYVPSFFSDDLDKLKRIVEQIGDSHLYSVSVPKDECSVASVSASATDHLVSLAQDVITRLDRWDEGTANARPSSLAKAVQEIKDIRAQAALYSESLEVRHEAMEERLELAQSRLKVMMQEAGFDGVVPARKPPRALTVARLREAIESCSPSNDGSVLVTPESFAAVGLGVSRWAKNRCDWKPGTYQQQAAEACGYVGTHTENGVRFVSIGNN